MSRAFAVSAFVAACLLVGCQKPEVESAAAPAAVTASTDSNTSVPADTVNNMDSTKPAADSAKATN